MKKFRVEFLPPAERDLDVSLEWGASYWGKKAAQKWLREFYSTCKKRLGQFPAACPIAPESADLGRELRHLIVGRYRAIFFVTDDTVKIVNVRGPYFYKMVEDDEDLP